MMRLLRAAVTLILICVASPVLAQDPRGRSIYAPSGYLPSTAIYCDDGTNHAVVCSIALDATVKLAGPADDVGAITPSDTVALASIPKALLVTASGTLAVKGSSGTAVSLGTVTAGQVIPIRARYVMATGTSATVVALY